MIKVIFKAVLKNIFLPTDFSENSKNAIRSAMNFFKGETCTFHILNSQNQSSYITADVLYGALGTKVYEGILNDTKKEIGFERFSIKNIPASIAINVFQRLIPIQLHAMVVKRKSFLDRFIFGSETSKINYTSLVPLLVLHE